MFIVDHSKSSSLGVQSICSQHKTLSRYSTLADLNDDILFKITAVGMVSTIFWWLLLDVVMVWYIFSLVGFCFVARDLFTGLNHFRARFDKIWSFRFVYREKKNKREKKTHGISLKRRQIKCSEIQQTYTEHKQAITYTNVKLMNTKKYIVKTKELILWR